MCHCIASKILIAEVVYAVLWVSSFGLLHVLTRGEALERVLQCNCGKKLDMSPPEGFIGAVMMAGLPFVLVFLLSLCLRGYIHKRRCLPGLIHSI